MRKSLFLKNEPCQRICITFGRGEELKFLTHLDMMRLWVRALRRAGMPLAYTQGFSPHPRIAIAAPLALGVTSENEFIDVFLDRRAALEFFSREVSRQLPAGIEMLGIKELWPKLPSLQSQLRFAEYLIEIESDFEPEKVELAIQKILSASSLPWQHVRNKEVRKYDLRMFIDDLWQVNAEDSSSIIGMRLRTDSRGSGRPEQVALALGFADPPKSIHRTKLIFAAG